jgi:hypothetical protein
VANELGGDRSLSGSAPMANWGMNNVEGPAIDCIIIPVFALTAIVTSDIVIQRFQTSIIPTIRYHLTNNLHTKQCDS